MTDGARDGFLITEAVRGEGAKLLDAGGERFVDELAPRDEVALAIEAELARSGERVVGLDLATSTWRASRTSPTRSTRTGSTRRCDPVPVAPAAHYTMGGVATDLDGRAVAAGPATRSGECACTGLHGANRLASNSLAECFVLGRRAALAAPPSRSRRAAPGAAPPPGPPALPPEPPAPRSGATPGLQRDAAGLASSRGTRSRSRG